MAHVYTDNLIADPLEAKANTLIEHEKIETGNGNFIFDNTTISLSDNAWVFCFSRGEFSLLKLEMTRPSDIGDAYDACVQIIDASTLVNSIREQGTFGSGLPVGEFFDFSGPFAIRYDGPERHVYSEDGELRKPNPVTKRPAFSMQSEVRIIARPKPEALAREPDLFKETLFFKIPNPDLHFRAYGDLEEIPPTPELDCSALVRVLQGKLTQFAKIERQIQSDLSGLPFAELYEFRSKEILAQTVDLRRELLLNFWKLRCLLKDKIHYRPRWNWDLIISGWNPRPLPAIERLKDVISEYANMNLSS